MKFFYTFLIFFSSLTVIHAFNHLAPDEVIMNDGTHYKGLIIKNDAREIILQQESGEHVIPKAAIQRIDDVSKSMVYFSDLVAADQAPSWRMMVQDMRCNDAVKSFIQIPATTISEGYLKNVPYLSFHINKHAEMNIYGDPNHPACIEFGTYNLKKEHLKKFQEISRELFAGYITSRAGIKTLYSLNLEGDKKRVGSFIFRIMPPSDPSSSGGWWISIYDPVLLKKARVSDAKYHQVTLPENQVRTPHGALRYDLETLHLSFLNRSMKNWLGKLSGFRGFYRDQNNELKMMSSSSM